jgi:hypothetical protein
VRDDLDHVLRPILPWRDERLTECGRTDVSRAIGRDEFVAKVRREGKQRSAMTTCMTCWNTALRWKDWRQSPSDVMRRALPTWPSGPDRADDELRAIAALIAEHRDEFDGYLNGLGDTVSLSDHRSQRLRASR